MLEKFYALMAKVPQDKALHYITLQVLAVGILLIGPKSLGTLVLAVVVCLLVATYKELRDMGDPHHQADIFDVLAGMSGLVVVGLLYLVLVIP